MTLDLEILFMLDSAPKTRRREGKVIEKAPRSPNLPLLTVDYPLSYGNR